VGHGASGQPVGRLRPSPRRGHSVVDGGGSGVPLLVVAQAGRASAGLSRTAAAAKLEVPVVQRATAQELTRSPPGPEPGRRYAVQQLADGPPLVGGHARVEGGVFGAKPCLTSFCLHWFTPACTGYIRR